MVASKRWAKAESSRRSWTKLLTTRIWPITSEKRPEAASISVFFSPSMRCQCEDVRAVSHMYSGKTTAISTVRGHAYHAEITSTARVVSSIVKNVLEKAFTKFVTSVMERLRREMIVPVSSESK